MLDAVVIVPSVRPAPVIAGGRGRLRQVHDVRHRHVRQAGRNHQRHRAARRDVRARRRVLTDHRARRHRRARRVRDRAERQARAGDRRRRRRLRQVHDIRHRHVRRAGRDDQRHRAARRDLRPATGILTDHRARRHRRADRVRDRADPRPAPVIAAVAAACVRFDTFGTATCGGPVETTSATALPAATLRAADGILTDHGARRHRQARSRS